MRSSYGTLLATLASLAAAFTPTPYLETKFPTPYDDPFYQAPANISSFAPGQVIRSRQVVTVVTGLATKSYQLFYRTNDNKNKTIGTVATVWVPTIPASPPKIFSYQQAEDALTLDCAPSWAWVNTSSSQPFNYYLFDSLITWGLSQGYYVVVSDNEGPDSAWIVGLTEGRGTLDGIRATQNFLALPSGQTQIALTGYSGGGHSSVWASSIAAQYAPELNIVGAAFGGTPIDLASTYTLLNGSPGAALAGGALIGLANGYPALNASFQSILTPNGTATVAKLRSPKNCINTVQSAYAGFDFNTLFTQKPLDNPVVQDILGRESLLSNVSTVGVPVPKFPRYQWHGTKDVTVPFGPEAAYVQQQCDRGADIRFLTLPGADHATGVLLGLPGALAFIRQAFDGTLTKVACGKNATAPAIGSSATLDVLGFDFDFRLYAALALNTVAAS